MGDIQSKRRLLDLLQKKRTKQCEASLYEFLKDAFKVLNPNKKLQGNWHIEEVCDHIQEKIEKLIKGIPQKGIIINIPPRSLKSEMIICMTSWAWIKSPGIKIISDSYAAQLSTKHNVKARRLIESQWYQERWGDKVTLSSDQNAKLEFQNTEGGLRMITSTGGGVTGSGCDIYILDDPCNPKKAASKTEREASIAHFTDTASSRLDEPEVGFFMIIAQRLHEYDLIGKLLEEEPEEWELICIPATINDSVSPAKFREKYIDGMFFPDRFTKAYLKKMAKRMTSIGYSCQYDQLPAPDEGNILLKAWFEIITVDQFIQTSPSNFRIDTAYTEKQSNDPSGFLAWCTMHNDMIILSAIDKHLAFPGLCKFLEEWVNLHGYTDESKVKVEPKASGISVVQQMRKITNLNIMKGKPPKDDKVTRANAIAPTVEAGKVKLLKGPWNKAFLHQVGFFPNAKNDDMVDCLIEAVRDFNRSMVSQYQ